MTNPPLESDNARERMLALRVDDVVRSAPIASLASIFAALALSSILARGEAGVALSLWLACIVVINLARLFLPLVVEDGSPEANRARNLWRGHMICGFANGLAFAIGLPLLLAVVGGFEAGFALLVVGGLLAAQLVSARAVPRLALGFLAMITVGASAAVLFSAVQSALAMIIVLFAQAGILARVISAQDAAFVEGIGRDLAYRESTETVRLLLNDYEQHSSDWLWTADAQGRFCAVSQRFGDASGRGAHALEGQPLGDIFAFGTERDKLDRLVESRQSFRDVVLPIEVRGDMHFWALSARMLEDGRISGFARDVTSAQRAQQKVARMAHFDELTGLANRNLLNRALRELTKQGQGRVTLLYLDLDDFKAINDTQGHALGDRLLKEIGQRIKGTVRESDMAARLGGDEFAIVIDAEASDRAIAARARAILAAIAEPISVKGQEFRLSASIGIARGQGADCEAQELLRRADLALYAAKRKGRGRYALFEAALDEAARERRDIEQELRVALSHNQFEVHYQPIIELDSGRVIGHEALLRWQHPARGEVLPGRFIPVAEDSGLIIPLGEWVIGEALREVADWDGDTRIAINLSPLQLRSPNLIPVVKHALDETGLDPQRLELEITEGALMRNIEANRAVLLKLRELGIHIALDDFGTGYSSLSYLRSFPFDKIKIDRTFVSDVVDQADSQAIIAAVTRLAAALGMRTTAEGVERVEQLEMLRKLGCNEAQGFLIARPARASELDSEEAELALPTPLPAEIIDYRKARKAAQRRAKQDRGKRARRA